MFGVEKVLMKQSKIVPIKTKPPRDCGYITLETRLTGMQFRNTKPDVRGKTWGNGFFSSCRIHRRWMNFSKITVECKHSDQLMVKITKTWVKSRILNGNRGYST